MNQLTCINKADLRIELGRLRHDRHAIEHELQSLEAQLNNLKARKQLNAHQIRALEKQLAHGSGAAICLPSHKDFNAGEIAAISESESLDSTISSLDVWPLAVVSLLITAAAVWIWLF